MERPDPLGSQPFSYLSRADGTILICYRQAPVTLLRGKSAMRFVSRMERADAASAQLLMARTTGNFKRGNEGARKRPAT